VLPLLSLWSVPILAYLLARRLKPPNRWRLTGVALGLVAGPASLGLYGLSSRAEGNIARRVPQPVVRCLLSGVEAGDREGLVGVPTVQMRPDWSACRNSAMRTPALWPAACPAACP